MKSIILFKDDHFPGSDAGRRLHRVAANDNVRSLEFDLDSRERDWRAPCLIAAIATGFAVFIFAPLW